MGGLLGSVGADTFVFLRRPGDLIRLEGRPARSERNDDSFEWRQTNELVRENTVEGLQARVAELTDRIEEYRDEYDTESPAEVDVFEVDAERDDDVSVDFGEWATAIEERRLHERARRNAADQTAPSPTCYGTGR